MTDGCLGGTVEALIKKHVREIPDFPKPGILFKDITPILEDASTFRRVIDAMTEWYQHQGIQGIVGIESRGFIFGTPLAYNLRVPFLLARKKGKLPAQTVEVTYDLEYGTATIEMHADAVQRGQRLVIIDDLLATGGTAAATAQLVEQQGGKVAECTFVIELAFLHGRDRLKNYEVCTLARYE